MLWRHETVMVEILNDDMYNCGPWSLSCISLKTDPDAILFRHRSTIFVDQIYRYIDISIYRDIDLDLCLSFVHDGISYM